MDVTFHLIVPPYDDELYTSWKNALDELLPESLRSKFTFVREKLGNLSGVRFDAIVSPANSYGRMDGAFDDAISKLLSPPSNYLYLTKFVQAQLYLQWRGFIPPGSAMILKLPDDVVDDQKDKTGCKYLAMCPTMHWPQNIAWDRDIVYNVTWSLLSELDRHNRCSNSASDNAADGQGAHDVMAEEKKPVAIRSILLSGLGTGVGHIPPTRFARQFAMAIKNFDDAIRSPEKWSSLEWDDIEEVIQDVKSTWTE